MFFSRKRIIRKMRKKLKERCILDKEQLISYSQDESSEEGLLPLCVVFPEKKEEVQWIVKSCRRAKIPFFVRGAGSGKTGGALLTRNGVVICLERMNAILIDKQNMLAEVEAGAITQQLQKEASRYGLYYPVDPASLDVSTIGGNIAENAGGPHAFKYGVTRDYVLGLEIILPNGKIISLGGKTRKNVTGYNLKDLFIGSEGTLGIITKAYLKLLPLPQERFLLWAIFDNFFDAIETINKVFTSGYMPSCIEFIEGRALKAVEKMENKTIPYSSYEAHIWIEVDGNEKDCVLKEAKKISEILYQQKAKEVLVIPFEDQQESLWNIRRKISEATHFISFNKKSEDVVIPASRLVDFLKKLKELEKFYGVDILCYGHLGDGNIHVNILNTHDESGITWEKFKEKLVDNLFNLTIENQGDLSGEHGIGLTKKKYFRQFCDKEVLVLHKKIKKMMDPKNLLNPDKIW